MTKTSTFSKIYTPSTYTPPALVLLVSEIFVDHSRMRVQSGTRNYLFRLSSTLLCSPGMEHDKYCFSDKQGEHSGHLDYIF